jgi:hypothetical protein
MLTVGRSHFCLLVVIATLKSDEKGRYALGGFLPRRSDVRVEKNPDGSVTLHPVKRRMSRTEVAPGRGKDLFPGQNSSN